MIRKSVKRFSEKIVRKQETATDAAGYTRDPRHEKKAARLPGRPFLSHGGAHI
jgi:hypothetical protein